MASSSCRATEDVEVTGIMTGYRNTMVSNMRQAKITRVIRTLRAFVGAWLSHADRVVVSRCVAISTDPAQVTDKF